MNHEEEYNLGGVIDHNFDYNSLNALLESHTEIPRSFSDPRDSSLYGALGKTPPNSPPPSISIILEEVDISSPSDMSTPDSRLSYSPSPASIPEFKGFQSKPSGPFCCPFPNCSGKVISNEDGNDGIKEHGRQCSEEKVRVALHLFEQDGGKRRKESKLTTPIKCPVHKRSEVHYWLGWCSHLRDYHNIVDNVQ